MEKLDRDKSKKMKFLSRFEIEKTLQLREVECEWYVDPRNERMVKSIHVMKLVSQIVRGKCLNL